MPRVALRRSFSPVLSGEGGGEFLAGGVVLHGGGIGFGVGEDFAGGVDDGGAGAGGLAFLRGDFGERVGAVGLDAVREEKSLLSEVALDLGAERGFPGAADHDVENGGGGGDDDQEDGEQLEEDAVLHVLGVLRMILGCSHLGTSKR